MTAEDGGQVSVYCPYCSARNTDPWDHDWGTREELVTSCGECGKDYTLVRRVSVDYEALALPEDT